MASRTFDEMDRLFDRMDRMMADVRGRFDAEGPMGMGFSGGLHATWHAAEDEHVLVLDVPGFEKSDFDIHVSDDVLTIAAEHAVDDPDAGAWSTRRISERVSLPADADPEHVTATYRNGVLDLRFPRVETTGTRIDVE